MQKKLLGMAVAVALTAPALALAQSSVQVYGTVHMSVNQVKFGESADGTLGSTTKYGVTSHASNWGLRSTETLGGGMTAWFQAEFNLQMARNNGVTDGNGTTRNSGLGLRGAFGNVYVGTWETPWAQTFRMWDVGTIGGWGPTTSIIGRRETTGTNPSRNCINNTGSGGGALSATSALITGSVICGNGAERSASGAYPLWTRYGYGMFYESPVFSGVQFKLAIDPNDRKSNFTTTSAAPVVNAGGSIVSGVNENPSSWSASLAWTGMGGRARAFLANMRNKDWSNVGSTDSGWTFGGGYDFGPVNLGAVYERFTYKPATGDVKAKQYAFSAAVPLGSGKIGASYAKAKSLEGAAGDTGAKMWNIGYEWALSKRTALGFGVAKIDNESGAGFTWTAQVPNQQGGPSPLLQPSGVDQTNIFVSIRHSF